MSRFNKRMPVVGDKVKRTRVHYNNHMQIGSIWTVEKTFKDWDNADVITLVEWPTIGDRFYIDFFEVLNNE